MRGGFVLPLLTFAGLDTLVVLGRVHGIKASIGRSSMTAKTGSLTPTAVRARTESEERVSFLLHVQTSPTLSTSLSFILYPSPTPFPTVSPSNSTSSLEHTLTPVSLNSTTSIPSPQPTTAPKDQHRPKETWLLNIESGNKGVHIGSWTPDVTYYGIRRGLRERCGDPIPQPLSSRKKKAKPAKPAAKEWGFNACSSQDSLYDREYATKLGLQRLESKLVQVKIASSYIPAELGLNLQNVLIEQIADMFRLAVTDDKNCHGFNTRATSCVFCIPNTCVAKVGPDKGHKLDSKTLVRRWCNVPDYVRVGLAGPDGKEVAHMRVEVRITCPGNKRLADEGCIMEMGRFDCMAVVGATGGEARVNGTRSDMLKKATQGKDVDVVAVCPSKEVTGKCPNKECVYNMGCFGKA